MSTLFCISCKQRFKTLRCLIKYEDSRINDEAYLYGPSYVNFPTYECICEDCYQSYILNLEFVQTRIQNINETIEIQSQNQIQDLQNKITKLELIINEQQNSKLQKDLESQISFMNIDRQFQQQWRQIEEFVTHKITQVNILSLELQTQSFVQQLDSKCKQLIENEIYNYFDNILILLRENIDKCLEDKQAINLIQQQFFENNQNLINSGCLVKEIFEKSFEDNTKIKDLERKQSVYEEGLNLQISLRDPQSLITQ